VRILIRPRRCCAEMLRLILSSITSAWAHINRCKNRQGRSTPIGVIGSCCTREAIRLVSL